MPELSRTQVLVYGAVAVALLLVGARAIRGEGGAGGSVAEAAAGAASAGGPARAANSPSAAKPATWSSTSPARWRGPASTGCRRAAGSTTRSSGPAARPAGPSWKRSTWRRGWPTGSRWSCPSGGRPAPRRAPAGGEEGPISLGTATVEELDTIDGIGPVTAEDIVEFRDEHGGLASVDQLDQISGIGPATMEALRERLQP